MTYRIAIIGDRPMRLNDGSMILMAGAENDEDTHVVLHVPTVTPPKRGEGWKHDDPAQEAFAQRVVDLLNAAEAA